LGRTGVASADSIISGALQPPRRGLVLKLCTGDGRTRRAEFSEPTINSASRALVLKTGRTYDSGVMQLLNSPWRSEFGHHRYGLAIQ